MAGKGFEIGKYYNSETYLAAVEEYFNIKCYTTFKNDGYQTVANEISVLVKKESMQLDQECVQLRDHPLHDFVGVGKFLLPNI